METGDHHQKPRPVVRVLQAHLLDGHTIVHALITASALLKIPEDIHMTKAGTGGAIAIMRETTSRYQELELGPHWAILCLALLI